MTSLKTPNAPAAPADVQRRLRDAYAAAGIVARIADPEPAFTDNAIAVLNRRYLKKDLQSRPTEAPEDMFRRVAENLSQADLNYEGATAASRQATADRFYQVMRRLDFMPNSPTLMNAGRELQQLSACFVLPVADSLESIFGGVLQTALIHKSGGGTGFSFNRIRPEGDLVGSTNGVASGPVSFINAYDAATDVVKQGGTRRGANMGILNVDHPDILRFINAKADGQHLNNFNISVAVTEAFMAKAAAGADYHLVNPRTGQKTGQLNAREVFDQITRMAWQTGDPGIVFLDRINRDNPNPQLGAIESTNPCGEQPLLPYESCNLGSLNLARMVKYGKDQTAIDWKRLERTVTTGVHMLDNVIDMNRYPIPEIERMSKQTRRIGLGVMGFSDLLLQLGLRYDSPEALDLGEQLMARIQQATYQASKKLAKERGVFPAWPESVYNSPEAANKMRNSAPVTIAPTGTISIISGASSGIEPLFALSYVRNVMDRTRLIEGNEYFAAVARHEGFHSPELMEALAQAGSLDHIDPGLGVPQWVKDLFRTSHDIAPEWHVRMQAAFQKHTDNSVSKTINFPNSAQVADIADAYRLAYETGCKGITVYRDGAKADQVLSSGSPAAPAAAAAPATAPEGTLPPNGAAPERRPYLAPQERPRRIPGYTERIRTGHGNMYITVNSDDHGRPFEVFSALGKAGGCDSAQLEAISRLVSMALRAGVDAQEIINQLQGITCCPFWDNGTMVNSAPDAVALALISHVQNAPPKPNHTDNHASQLRLVDPTNAGQTPRPAQPNGFLNVDPARKCPECNNQLIAEEGCMKCLACGWNRCE